MTLSEEFLAKGIVKIPAEDLEALNKIRSAIFIASEKKRYPQFEWQKTEPYFCKKSIFNNMHKYLDGQLNEYRLYLIKYMNSESWLTHDYFSLAKSALQEIVGNELVMQRNINLSIQFPDDDSSLLPIHCDTWSGDSPYEVVLWVPLVDCYDTKSMFFCDYEADKEIQPKLHTFKDSEELYQAVKPHAKFMDVKYGECLIFTQNIMHGNRINRTNETRWSLNCRFKSLFSPYADKKLGEFFEPITIRPATKLGMKYQLPCI